MVKRPITRGFGPRINGSNPFRTMRGLGVIESYSPPERVMGVRISQTSLKAHNSMVEWRPDMALVAGSNPVVPTTDNEDRMLTL